MTESGSSEQLERMAGTPVSELVLHCPPMLALERLLEIGPGFAICELQLHEDTEFVLPGRGVPSYTGVEYMAQCIAVYGGACARLDGLPPQSGMLLGSRHYRASEPYFELDVAYQVKCEELARNAQGMAAFDGQILLKGRVVAEGRLAVLQNQQGA